MSAAEATTGLQIIKELEDHLTVTTNGQKMLQILRNLVLNAKQACKASSQKEKRMVIRAAKAGERVRLQVIDNGVGILPENLPRIFTQGFTTKKNGRGFGLHSSLRLAQGLGGSLLVHSTGPGGGATFTLELPEG